MAQDIRPKPRKIVLVKWRFDPGKDETSSRSKYWWSDGSKTEQPAASYLDAVGRLRIIQDGGGEKPH
jgi:hypothetical protein